LAVIWAEAAGKTFGPGWSSEAKEAFANRVLGAIERHAPGLREQIFGKAIISPTDLEKLNLNLVDGDLMAGSQHRSQFHGQRPFLGDSRSPIEKLTCAGLRLGRTAAVTALPGSLWPSIF
jgi:phytoene dehydrogenase-like protein